MASLSVAMLERPVGPAGKEREEFGEAGHAGTARTRGRFAKGLDRSPPAGGGPEDVVVVAVADVQNFGPRRSQPFFHRGKETGVRFFKTDFAGDEDFLKVPLEPHIAQKRSQALVPVREHGEAVATLSEFGENSLGMLGRPPSPGFTKGCPEIPKKPVDVEEIGKVVKGAGDDAAPAFLFAFGCDGRHAFPNVFPPDPQKALLQNAGISFLPMAQQNLGVNFADRRVRKEEGSSDVKRDPPDLGKWHLTVVALVGPNRKRWTNGPSYSFDRFHSRMETICGSTSSSVSRSPWPTCCLKIWRTPSRFQSSVS